MFTGLVEEVGRVVGLEADEIFRLRVSANRVIEGTRIGDSVSVNGVCLTVNELEGDTLVFNAMPETLRRTALGDLTEGSMVNLERAMSLERRFGGHIVQGHVDGVGEVVDVRPEGDAQIWEFRAPEGVLRYIVEKGSVCVDGISLTVVSVRGFSFTVSILPQTRANTNLGGLGPRAHVNVEADVIAKYVERLVEPMVGQNYSEDSEVLNPERSVEDAI
ncbi:MAG TPA: riboflavin synthase [Rubrobacteraceae bacterium]|nr:riboflavin synthase [Rubrobacteraceae bacterium]